MILIIFNSAKVLKLLVELLKKVRIANKGSNYTELLAFLDLDTRNVIHSSPTPVFYYIPGD